MKEGGEGEDTARVTKNNQTTSYIAKKEGEPIDEAFSSQ